MTSRVSTPERPPSELPVRTYSLTRNHYIAHRRVDRIIARGLSWEVAKSLAQTLQARESTRREFWSSWTGRIFFNELEGTPRWNRLVNPQPNRQRR